MEKPLKIIGILILTWVLMRGLFFYNMKYIIFTVGIESQQSAARKLGIGLIIVFVGFLVYTVLGFLLLWLSVSVLDAHPGAESLIT